MIYPKDLENIIAFYKKLPGIGEKSAERLALATLSFDYEELDSFSKSLENSKKILKPCKICAHITDEDLCAICKNDSRDKKIICVIEDYKGVFAFEKAGNYNGVYHVLGGLINPMAGVSPEDTNIASLLKRVRENKDVEIIMALKSSIEGETTTMYITKLLEKEGVVISRLSYGIPMGAEIDYLDVFTLEKALEDRKRIAGNGK